jgi:putative hydrolase of the HAD superfamily
MIKTLIFDLGGVIVPFDFQRAYKRLEPLCSLTTEEMRQRIRATDLVTRFETGLVGSEEFVLELSRTINLTASAEEFHDLWNCIFLKETLIPEELFVALKRRYRLMLLSNTNALHFQMLLANYPLLRHMDAFILSYEVRSMKPAPEIYRAALEQAECKPEECFYTDDLIENVEGARRHGMDAVQFVGLDQLRADLKAREITTE